MSKNKGLAIELTSLLDVILIMLFWVMMVSSDKADKAEQDADAKVAAANAQAQQQIDSAVEEANKNAEKYINERLAEQREQLDMLDEYIKTVEGFENGEMLSISITYVDSSEMLSFTRAGEQLSSVVVTSYSNIEYEIRRVLDMLPDRNGIILAAFIYDGNTALYRDVQAVRQALEGLRKDYSGIYFAYINTSGQS